MRVCRSKQQGQSKIAHLVVVSQQLQHAVLLAVMPYLGCDKCPLQYVVGRPHNIGTDDVSSKLSNINREGHEQYVQPAALMPCLTYQAHE